MTYIIIIYVLQQKTADESLKRSENWPILNNQFFTIQNLKFRHLESKCNNNSIIKNL